MTVQVRSWILLGPSVLHVCSGAHVASCRVVFWRPLITDVLAPAPAHLLMGGRSTWRSVPHDTLQLLFSRSFPHQPWRLPGAFDLGVMGSTDGDVLASTSLAASDISALLQRRGCKPRCGSFCPACAVRGGCSGYLLHAILPRWMRSLLADVTFSHPQVHFRRKPLQSLPLPQQENCRSLKNY